jgi:hypothetical protein
MADHRFESASLRKEMRGVRNDRERLLAREPLERSAIEVEHRHVIAAHDQKRRRANPD